MIRKMEKPFCSVIIVNWNGKGALATMLRSLTLFEDSANLQVIVSDNGSTDGSVQMLRSEFPFVTVVENRANIGFGAGNNSALPFVESDYVLFANPDMEFIEPVIARLLETLVVDREIGAIGPRILNSDGSFMRQCKRGFPDPATSLYYLLGLGRLFPSSRRFGKYFMSYLPDDEPADVDALSGSFFMTRSSTIREAGGFNEFFFLFVEEVELFLRFRRAGFAIRYMPDVKVVHHGGACFDSAPRKRLFYHYHMTRSHLILFAKERIRDGGGIGYHLAFLLIMLRYLGISIIAVNTGIFRQSVEFIRIHFGKFEKLKAGV